MTPWRDGLALMRLVIGLLAAPVMAADALPAGGGSFLFAGGGDQSNEAITVWYYRPAGLAVDARVVVVMHGLGRNGRAYRDHWTASAQQHGFLVLAPEFPARDFPSERYQFGNVRHPDPERWTFAIIERLFDHVRERENLRRTGYILYGHSAGAQFVHRMMLFAPSTRVELAMAANAGSYTLPVVSSASTLPFPWSMDSHVLGRQALPVALARPLWVLLGEMDVDLGHPSLPRSRQAMSQGAHRLQRGQYFYQTAKDQAANLGVDFNWRLVHIPGVAHSDRGMARAAQRLLRDEKVLPNP